MGYDNMMGSFNETENSFAYYENPSLVDGEKTYMSYYNKYNIDSLKTALISQSFKMDFINFGIYVLHFQKRPYKEEEYGAVFSKEVFDKFRFGVNLKLLRNILYDKNLTGFSYDAGGSYSYKNHHIAISFRNIEKPYLADRLNMDFIMKYSYIRNFYTLNFRYVKIYSLYEYYLVGCEFNLSKWLRLSYSLTTKKNENRLGIKINLDRYIFDLGYITHPGLKNYMAVGVGIKW